MFRKAKPFFIICETPLHAGSGADLGVVDMPIQREKHTDYPKIEASGLKGSIKESFEETAIEEYRRDGQKSGKYKMLDTRSSKLASKFPAIFEGEYLKKEEKYKTKYHQAISLAFGPEDGNVHAGALGFTDARILLFPVKSMKGVFAWITCPQVLQQFKKNMELAGVREVPTLPTERTVPDESELLIGDTTKLVLEEYTFNVNEDKNNTCKKFASWLSDIIFSNNGSENVSTYWADKMKKDIVILPDDDFRDFVNLSTEVITRTKIDNTTGTVQSGALFTEEYLPADTIMYALALASPIFNNEKGIFKQVEKEEHDMLMDFFIAGLPEILQVGGNATIGKGLVRLVLVS